MQFLCYVSTMHLLHKPVKQIPGLRSRHCMPIHKQAYILIFLRHQKGILSLLTVKVILTHTSHPPICLSMSKILHFLAFVLHLLVVLVHLLLPRLVISTTCMFSCIASHEISFEVRLILLITYVLSNFNKYCKTIDILFLFYLQKYKILFYLRKYKTIC